MKLWTARSASASAFSFRLEKYSAKARSRLSGNRSEEHTSELQSRLHLVCRLLLEKKKKKIDMFLIRITIIYKMIYYRMTLLYLTTWIMILVVTLKISS